jgi:hypothetical protein
MPSTAPTDAPDLQVLEAFVGARHHTRRRPIRRLGVLLTGIVASVALVALATHDRSAASGPLDLAGGQLASPPAATGAPAQGGVPSSAPPGGTTPASGVGGVPVGGRAPGAPAPGAPAAAPAPAPPYGAAPSLAGDDRPAPADVAVVTPLLKTFAFGSSVGLPLLCNVAASAAIAQLPDENLAMVATNVVTACIEFGIQGGDAIRGMNTQLRQLEAVNPAAAPVITALADTFNTAGSQQVPFADSLKAMSDLVRFFGPPS